MRRRLSIGVLLLTALGAAPAAIQGQGGDAPPRTRNAGFELQQNYPNPFNPTTRIPFVLDPVLFESGEPVVVTMRIYNVLQQLVAVPQPLSNAGGAGDLGRGLEYTTPGPHEAFWDGYDQNGRQVASGIYYLQLVVNGRRQIMKMIVAK